MPLSDCQTDWNAMLFWAPQQTNPMMIDYVKTFGSGFLLKGFVMLTNFALYDLQQTAC